MKNKSKILAISSFLSITLASSPIPIAGELYPLLPANAIQLTKQRNPCDNALASVEQKIGENRDIPVKFEWEDIPDEYWQEDRPPDGQKIVVIDLGRRFRGDRMGNLHHIEDVMNSPQFRNTLATQIINTCTNASGVMFGFSGTDWIESHGLVNGKVKPFECLPLPPGRGGPRPSETWGFVYC